MTRKNELQFNILRRDVKWKRVRDAFGSPLPAMFCYTVHASLCASQLFSFHFHLATVLSHIQYPIRYSFVDVTKNTLNLYACTDSWLHDTVLPAKVSLRKLGWKYDIEEIKPHNLFNSVTPILVWRDRKAVKIANNPTEFRTKYLPGTRQDNYRCANLLSCSPPITVTDLNTSRSHQKRTTLQHVQRCPGEWKQLTIRTEAKLATLGWYQPSGKRKWNSSLVSKRALLLQLLWCIVKKLHAYTHSYIRTYIYTYTETHTNRRHRPTTVTAPRAVWRETRLEESQMDEWAVEVGACMGGRAEVLTGDKRKAGNVNRQASYGQTGSVHRCCTAQHL